MNESPSKTVDNDHVGDPDVKSARFVKFLLEHVVLLSSRLQKAMSFENQFPGISTALRSAMVEAGLDEVVRLMPGATIDDDAGISIVEASAHAA